MKNEKKHPQNDKNETPPKSTPSQEQVAPPPPALRDLTDTDLEEVQGGNGPQEFVRFDFTEVLLS